MRKINTLFTANSQLDTLAKNVQTHQHLQQFWQAAIPILFAQSTFVSSLNSGQLTVYADSAIVANKIKLIHASLLTQLQNLQKTHPLYGEYKVTAIVVKVQVKSRVKPIAKAPRKLSANAANSLKHFANSLGESPLALKLTSLASKID